MSTHNICDFDDLLNLCRDSLKKETNADQVVGVEFQDGKIEILINKGVIQGNYSDEDAFVDLLSKNNCESIIRTICIWNDGALDIPSANLRSKLRSGGFVTDESEILLSTGTKGKVIKTWNQIK